MEIQKILLNTAIKNIANLIIIAVSGVTNLFDIKELLNIGIDAYLAKSAGSDELQTAIERTSAGEKYISVELAGQGWLLLFM